MTYFTMEDRRAWIGLLARAPEVPLEDFFENVSALPDIVELRAPEPGMIMVRGRIGGSGSSFNLGEMTVTRCSVSVLGHVGHAMVQGRRPAHAKLAALADALLQDAGWSEIIRCGLIEPLAQAEHRAAEVRTKEAAQTKVDFFTMVRGEDER